MMHAKHRFCNVKSLRKLSALLLLLCLVLAMSLPAFAEDIPTQSESLIEQAPANDAAAPQSDSDFLQEQSPAADNTESADFLADPPAAEPAASRDSSDPETDTETNPEELPEETPPPAPAPSVFTVSYHLSNYNIVTENVTEGQYPAHVPIADKKGYSFNGWVNVNGRQVNPKTVVINENTAFYAQYSRSLGDLLDIANHNSYVGGYETGMFKPDGSILRAEVAQIFYSLLLDKSEAPRSFSDVPADAWYGTPVSVLGGMEIISGYNDGRFRPLSSITRAEFVSMAVKFDELGSGAASFPDVPSTHWAAASIAAASQKGWVSGFSDGNFRPEQNLTRAEAVTIINGMLGRKNSNAANFAATATNFYDVYPEHWAYGQIIESSTKHTFAHNSDGVETWQWHEASATPNASATWVVDGSSKYYVDPATRKFAKGEHTIDGVTYAFDDSTRKLYNGWRYVNEWKRYYQDGLMVEDISDLGIVSGPYYIKVYKPANFLIIYALDGDNGYTIPVKSMVVSCGYGTPTGTYYTPERYRWLRMEGFTWAQWCTQISGNYLFHSVPNWTYNNFDLEVEEYNLLGQTRSMGCIRLTCKDAKWIYDNCSLGTEVFISGIEESGPLSKPSSIQIPSWHTWDPTDPTAYYRCQELGCH